MATQRAKDYSASTIRFGRGRAPEGGGKNAIRIGLQEPCSARSVKLTMRLTPREDEMIRQAHASYASGVPLGAYLAGLMAAGLAAASGGSTIPGGDTSGLEASVRILAEKVSMLEQSSVAAMTSIAKRQDQLGKVAVAQAKILRDLAASSDQRVQEAGALADAVSASLSRLAAERPWPAK